MELKEYLDINGISIQQFAYMMNRHPNTISGIIHKRYSPSLTLAQRIEDFTEGAVTLEEIYEVPNYDRCPTCRGGIAHVSEVTVKEKRPRVYRRANEGRSRMAPDVIRPTPKKMKVTFPFLDIDLSIDKPVDKQ